MPRMAEAERLRRKGQDIDRSVSFVCNNWNDGEGQKLAIKYAFEHTNQDGTHVANVFGAVNAQYANQYPAPNYQAVTLLEYKPAGIPEYELNH